MNLGWYIQLTHKLHRWLILLSPTGPRVEQTVQNNRKYIFNLMERRFANAGKLCCYQTLFFGLYQKYRTKFKVLRFLILFFYFFLVLIWKKAKWFDDLRLELFSLSENFAGSEWYFAEPLPLSLQQCAPLILRVVAPVATRGLGLTFWWVEMRTSETGRGGGNTTGAGCMEFLLSV